MDVRINSVNELAVSNNQKADKLILITYYLLLPRSGTSTLVAILIVSSFMILICFPIIKLKNGLNLF